ncbi:PREDICTED: E3 ubiquitin-protein ligase RLIM isoform X2 [Tarenaya hassleriana]|uniref:E3 ubiquitin-protein ligase RLIM isoform X1 n=1 Tax=Tarenaya hassleriana TaxID=28532 RepID=UPI00053C131F|nr:PREDICTED: E3 ubiquitin-protein ligase RLIM isoform X1 [Tarenaya hassleriana]XP_010529276.1 PREDICTED: E3 ubiquitin-protein ligase RLIM isoform X2 [Tarenaya hassleriana]
MGSSGSKPCRGSSAEAAGEANAAATASSGGRRRRSRGHWSLPSSCLSSASASHDSDNGEQVCRSWMRKSHGNGSNSKRRMRAMEPESRENADCYKESKEKDAEDEKNRTSSDEVELDECGEASVSNVLPTRNGSSGRASSSSRSLTTPGRIFSRFRFIPGNMSSRISRASSSRSLNSVSSSRRTTPNDREAVVITSPPETTGNFVDRNESRLENHTSPSNCSTYHVSNDDQHEHRVPIVDMHPPRGANEIDSNYTGFLDRHPVVREPSERNVRFSRTLSVGRLRDRVLRRSSLSDFTFRPSEHQNEDSDNTTLRGSGQATASAAETNHVTSISTLAPSPSSIRRSFFGIRDHEMQTPRVREGRYQDLLEHRSNFLERRRRIQSQVRALQRMGSRIGENVSGHDGSCPLGQTQAGRCTCRATNTTDETNARASISRIVMLAEALFEVLDEIHQQSVVLSSSQPSVSSIGSVPAPNDVVESLPVRLYAKSHKEQNDEASQCYICLLEYEEGDSVRTLPCHHEFHRTCVDKWLKEIHRVCPLCRGDICKAEQSPEGHS